MEKAVFWDFHGTLARADSLWSRSALKSLLENVPGCRVTLQDIRPHLQTGFTWHTPEISFTERTGERWWDDLFARFERIYILLGAPPEAARRAACRVRTEILKPGNYIIYEDAAAVLEKSRAKGWKNYILSNNFPELAQVIESLGLSGYFVGMIVSAMVGYEKPRSEIFEIALKAAGYPAQCLMVGDSPEADVAGGRAAGMKTVLVHSKTECGADYVFDTLSEIADIL